MKTIVNRFQSALAVLALGGTLGGGSVLAVDARAAMPEDGNRVRNVILLVSDGAGLEHYTLARWFKGEPLALDRARTGSVRTHIVGSLIGESAAAATAMATGHLSRAQLLGLAPAPPVGVNDTGSGTEGVRPFATVLEAARLSGRKVGIVATSAFTHATPAGFFAHVGGRADHDTIAAQAVRARLDLVLAGGWSHLVSLRQGGARHDSADLTQELRDQGCDVVRDAAAMRSALAPCLWGVFADEGMSPEIDRVRGRQEPSLAEMTSKAIDVLSRGGEGFFLMVEGSQIDWAAHANDPAHLVHDMLAYDDAAAVALDFAQQDGRTLVLAVSDHRTGGLWIAGRWQAGMGEADALVGKLRRMTCSSGVLVERLGPSPLSASADRVRQVVAEGWGLEISDGEARRIVEALPRFVNPGDRKYAFGEVLSLGHLGLGWGGHAHTGGDVPLHAFGPGRPTGTLRLVQVAELCADALALDLDAVTDRLFVDLGGVFGDDAVRVSRDGEEGPVVVVDVGGERRALLTLDGTRLDVGGVSHELEGLVFEVAGTGCVYAPRQAVELMTLNSQPSTPNP